MQYTEVYCDRGAKAKLDCIVIQCPSKPRYGQEACSRRAGHAGCTQGVQAGPQEARAGGRWALGAQASAQLTQARGVRGAGGSGARSSRGRGAARARGAHSMGAGRAAGFATGPASCALGALGLFSTWFDLVLFLSQFLDIVREPGS